MAIETSKVIQLNKSFYNAVFDDFSRSRSKPWDGWKQLLPYINDNNMVADLGCGDGRFLTFLESNHMHVQYEGYDISEKLITLAKQHHKNANFFYKDILTTSLYRNYDIVTCFGLIHHIPNIELRNKFLENTIKYINNRGLFILALWLFNPDKERVFNDKARELGITLGTNDYILDWGGSGANLRFCHLYTQPEINDLVGYCKNLGMSLSQEFTADRTNQYLILKKTV